MCKEMTSKAGVSRCQRFSLPVSRSLAPAWERENKAFSWFPSSTACCPNAATTSFKLKKTVACFS